MPYPNSSSSACVNMINKGKKVIHYLCFSCCYSILKTNNSNCVKPKITDYQ